MVLCVGSTNPFLHGLSSPPGLLPVEDLVAGQPRQSRPVPARPPLDAALEGVLDELGGGGGGRQEDQQADLDTCVITTGRQHDVTFIVLPAPGVRTRLKMTAGHFQLNSV